MKYKFLHCFEFLTTRCTVNKKQKKFFYVNAEVFELLSRRQIDHMFIDASFSL